MTSILIVGGICRCFKHIHLSILPIVACVGECPEQLEMSTASDEMYAACGPSACLEDVAVSLLLAHIMSPHPPVLTRIDNDLGIRYNPVPVSFHHHPTATPNNYPAVGIQRRKPSIFTEISTFQLSAIRRSSPQHSSSRHSWPYYKNKTSGLRSQIHTSLLKLSRSTTRTTVDSTKNPPACKVPSGGH
ncbi:hypothetical protein BO71DRAFT_39936 [Aspergillus ellipticus CBS 707.79]|uniref:Uncharacterized protein n=1 Tax=Aspergillus ellipticus CBS 707.79 TaxID=1448320 RepID=A0A319D2N0_9EURO|nr:hypothetical protein BO71DRAFT_39936 [Aspergillus ellipticus CBS 707.79]